ncbi:diguanylate cyclase [Litorilituus sediminis]|uniref:diguanylate cyclase n=1 Tax=Litorilituus sediminis TaxID=718192 RepID=A0A4P6P0V6_9GAMM|nr:diguanylate cyclase [Litorilituus sediminis]QBG34573.1 diguanylate cyclase [Litorilituus sediminis]
MTLPTKHSILVVDDAKDTQLLLAFDLSSPEREINCCDSGEQALQILKDDKVDLILLDLYMPGMSGLETLQAIKADKAIADIPVIMLSASDNEDEVVAALEYGASDYVVKPYVAKVLLARIGNALRLRDKTIELEYLASTDCLTGLNNRGRFFDLSTKAASQANRAMQPIAMVMLDIDHFKQVNDDYGHAIGDKVLLEFSRCFNRVFRDYDIVGRIGGEEFAVCLPNCHADEALQVCERFKHTVANTLVEVNCKSTKPITVTVSIGFAIACSKHIVVDDLLKQADLALYQAKTNGRNCVVNGSQAIDNNEESMQTIKNLTELESKEEQLIAESHKLLLAGIDIEIGISNVLGDTELFNEILLMFYQDHHLDGEKLQQAFADGDIKRAKHLVHTLKGVACSVGAMHLFELSKALDLTINEEKEADYISKLQLLLPELSLVMKSIEEQLQLA